MINMTLKYNFEYSKNWYKEYFYDLKDIYVVSRQKNKKHKYFNFNENLEGILKLRDFYEDGF